MASYRVQRLNGDFQKEISALMREMKDPRIDEFLSVMRCEVTSDLAYAKVYIGSINGGEHARQACEALKNAGGYMRTQLAKNLRIRKSPELIFVPDASGEYAEKIERKLSELRNEKD